MLEPGASKGRSPHHLVTLPSGFQQEFPLASKRLLVREAANRLKEDLKTFAILHNLILVTEGVIVGGDVPDKTDEFLAWLEKENYS
jgi:hypothetical protein